MHLHSVDKTYALGVDLGGTATKLGLFTTDGILLERHDFGTESANSQALIQTLDLEVTTLLERCSVDARDVTSVGVAVPAVVEAGENMHICVNVKLDLTLYRGCLQNIMPEARIVIVNDANAAALGEMWKGTSAHPDNLVLITLGTGVGAGIVVHGSLMEGCNGAAGEIGHLQVDTDETDICNCGRRGCLEQYASSNGMVRMMRKLLADRSEHSTLRESDGIGAKEIFDAADAGDTIAQEVVEVFIDKLALALAQVACMVEPDEFLLGGGLSGSADVYLDRLRQRYRDLAFEPCRDIPISPATLGNSAGIYGAAYRAMAAVR